MEISKKPDIPEIRRLRELLGYGDGDSHETRNFCRLVWSFLKSFHNKRGRKGKELSSLVLDEKDHWEMAHEFLQMHGSELWPDRTTGTEPSSPRHPNNRTSIERTLATLFCKLHQHPYLSDNSSQMKSSSIMSMRQTTNQTYYSGEFTEVLASSALPNNVPSTSFDVVQAQKRAMGTTQNMSSRQKEEKDRLVLSLRQTEVLMFKDLEEFRGKALTWGLDLNSTRLINGYIEELRTLRQEKFLRMCEVDMEDMEKRHEVERREDETKLKLPPMFVPGSERPGDRTSHANAQSRLQPLARGEAAHSRQFQHSTALHPVISNHNRLPPLKDVSPAMSDQNRLPSFVTMFPAYATNYRKGVSQPSSPDISGEVRPAKRQLPHPGYASDGSKRPRQQEGKSRDAPIVID
ncbi:hypothetical protein CGGC5_v005907 [Colletotrichum fructicola Nara gc5]|uniref:Uncharacterized protein n=1 Tax=Colletotrichum fructicola (strain Nara gc5) TaxID=1213859 RepID=A0A7J6JA18_COLFN|nr:hypothetical protein CGGC5_v005907 [Colletotrichum fructicola Nara gc5]